MFFAGGIIGLVSSFVGIGGGALSVPFMTSSNIRMHNAIGTSAAIGFPIAVAGTTGYVLNGLPVENLPAWSAGFIHLPSLACMVIASMLLSPLWRPCGTQAAGGNTQENFCGISLCYRRKIAAKYNLTILSLD